MSRALITLVVVVALALRSIYFALNFTDDLPSLVTPVHLDEQYHNLSRASLSQNNDGGIVSVAANNNATDIMMHNQTHKHERNGKTVLEIKIDKMSQKQKVFVLPNVTPLEAKGELSHFVLDGINRSTVLYRTFDVDDLDAVWVVDTVRFKCLPELAPLLWDLWRLKRRTYKWDIYILNFEDAHTIDMKCIKTINAIFNYRFSDHNICELLKKITDENDDVLQDDDDDDNESNCSDTSQSNIHYASRRHISGRFINSGIKGRDNTPFGMLGKRIDYKNIEGIKGVVRVLRYGVRSDLVLLIQRYWKTQTQNSSNINSNIVTLSRPNDIAHFWGTGDDKISGKLRSAVSNALLDFSTEQPSLIILAKQVGSRYNVGRNEAQESYAVALLQHKIVVVCQRDMWEGHYRLMEALAGGAMVMTDSMHPLPFKIKEGREVIVYRSIAELKKLAKYFLDHNEERLMIARSGFNTAMRFHQSWIWMERIILGDWTNEHGDS